MTAAQKKERMSEIIAALKEVYPEALCALECGGC